MQLYCVACGRDVEARLTSGAETYPNLHDLRDLPFWKCDQCGNHVGCHHKTKDRTRPLGCIPTPELKHARKEIHKILDPLWKSKRVKRKTIYGELTRLLGYQYHTADIRSIDDARLVYRHVRAISNNLGRCR